MLHPAMIIRLQKSTTHSCQKKVIQMSDIPVIKSTMSLYIQLYTYQLSCLSYTDIESTNIVVDQPLSTLLPGRSFTAHFRILDTHLYHDVVKMKKKHQANLKKHQEELDDCKTEVKAESFIQEEALEQASKSSRNRKKEK